MAGIRTEDFAQVQVASVEQLRAWLGAHHTQHDSIWLVTWKKAADPTRYVGREQVLDELLCVGWIDGVRRVLDDTRTMQLVGPRRVGHWARTYQVRAQRLIDTGRMLPAGLAFVEAAQRDGGWEAMTEVDDLQVPADLAAALEARTGACAGYEALAPSRRRFALRWIAIAKAAGTRDRRIQVTAERAAQGLPVPGA